MSYYIIASFNLKLTNLEKKLQQLEQTNFNLKEKITFANSESDYEALKQNVLSLISEHNRYLQKQMLNPILKY